jgi:hypothetical protein
MFKRTWKSAFRAVTSDEGYSVWLKGYKLGIEYSEGDHVLRVPIEPAGIRLKENWIIYPNPIKSWLAPHEHEPLSEEKRKQIRGRIILALDFLKVKYLLSE